MTPEQIELARRLVAASWWEWRPGVRASYQFADTPGMDFWDRVLADGHMAESNLLINDPEPWPNPITMTGVDLTDDATGGVLLGMLPATPEPGVLAHGQEWQTVELWYLGDEWQVSITHHKVIPFPGQPHAVVEGAAATGAGSTLAEACARALLAIHESDP